MSQSRVCQMLARSHTQHLIGAVQSMQRRWPAQGKASQPATGATTHVQHILTLVVGQKTREISFLKREQGMVLLVIDFSPDRKRMRIVYRFLEIGTRAHRLSRFGLRRLIKLRAHSSSTG